MSAPSETTPLKLEKPSNDDGAKDIVSKAEDHVSGSITTVELDAAEKHEEVKEELNSIKEDIAEGVEKHSKLIAIGLYVVSCFRVCRKEQQDKNTPEKEPIIPPQDHVMESRSDKEDDKK